jgi:CheY-like chemotaxis protein
MGTSDKYEKPDEAAIICCGDPKSRHANSAVFLADDCMGHSIYPHLFFFSPHTSNEKKNTRILSGKGYPVWFCGNGQQACLDIIYKLSKFKMRSWVGVAPDLPEKYNISREGIKFLWKMRPARDIVFTDMKMDDVLLNWAFVHLKHARNVICQTDDEKILYPLGTKLVSIHEDFRL